MRRPVVALMFDNPETWPKILSESKLITIREGHRDYRVGDTVMLCSHINPWCVAATVSSVRHCTLREITREEALADGFSIASELYRELKKFYPNIAWGSDVTIIIWRDVRGQMVEDYDRGRDFSGS